MALKMALVVVVYALCIPMTQIITIYVVYCCVGGQRDCSKWRWIDRFKEPCILLQCKSPDFFNVLIARLSLLMLVFLVMVGLLP